MQTADPAVDSNGSKEAVKTSCLHCGQKIPFWRQFVRTGGYSAPFCCNGCQAVYEYLQSENLGDFYALRNEPSTVAPVNSWMIPNSHTFDALDQGSFSKNTLTFYLEGMHCAACTWLIGQICKKANWTPSEINLKNRTVTVTKEQNVKWSEVAKAFGRIGYRAHVLSSNDKDLLYYQRLEFRSLLKRLGVSAFSALNIMLLAVAEYAGATGTTVLAFRLLSGLLFLPVLLYSAQPFFQSGLGALRNRSINMDVSISLGLVIGTIASLLGPSVYFDSMSALVFLLLLGRISFLRAREFGLKIVPGQLETLNYARVDGQLVPRDKATVGQTCEVLAGEYVPFLGSLESDSAVFAHEAVTGEVKPVRVAKGQTVLQGARLLSKQAKILIRSTEQLPETIVAQESVRSLALQNTPWNNFVNRVGKVFTLVTLAVGSTAFFYHLPRGIDSAVAVLFAVTVVACPCIFALVVPWIQTLVARSLSALGVQVRDLGAFEVELTEIFFDKTGTLTTENLEVTKTVVLDKTKPIAEIIVALESYSEHPVAIALLKHFANEQLVPLTATDVRPASTGGLSGIIDGAKYEILPGDLVSDEADIVVQMHLNQVVNSERRRLATVSMKHPIRSTATRVVHELKQTGLDVWVLSGDRKESALSVAKKTGVNERKTLYALSPAQKAEFMGRHPHSAIVGDGFNDILAFSHAPVSIAVANATVETKKTASLVLSENGFDNLALALQTMRFGRTTLRTAFFLSLIYNAVAITFAVRGQITPLQAAVLMPSVSLFLFFSMSMAFFFFNRRRKAL